MPSHYKNYNQRMLHEVAGVQHQQWLKERDRRALKRAKKDVAPALGIKSNSFQVIRLLK
jgi:hypothetical protein